MFPKDRSKGRMVSRVERGVAGFEFWLLSFFLVGVNNHFHRLHYVLSSRSVSFIDHWAAGRWSVRQKGETRNGWRIEMWRASVHASAENAADSGRNL